MSPTLPAIILDTVLGRLAPLFLISAGGNLTAARQAAQQMLAAYHPETPDELSLAAEIITFSFQALEALSQAAADISINQKLRLRGSAVSLSRESHKSQRKLDQQQKARRTGTPPPQAQATQPRATPSRAKETPQTGTRADQQRQAANRIAENLKKNQARYQSATAAPPQYAAAPVPPAQPPASPLPPVPRSASVPAENYPSHP
jgi:hypothetical protein